MSSEDANSMVNLSVYMEYANGRATPGEVVNGWLIKCKAEWLDPVKVVVLSGDTEVWWHRVDHLSLGIGDEVTIDMMPRVYKRPECTL
jgi:hypothetical protein